MRKNGMILRMLIVTNVFTLLLTSIVGCKNHNIMEMTNSLQDSYIEMSKAKIKYHPIYVFDNGDYYSVRIFDGNKLEEIVEFSSDRTLRSDPRVQLFEIDSVEELVNTDFNKVKEVFGEPHADIGSGFYIPSYITIDGFLVSFVVEDNIVIKVDKIDLLAGAVEVNA